MQTKIIRKFLLFFIVSAFCFNESNAQLQHCFSYTTIPYVNFFNKEKDVINKANLVQAFLYPNISYTVFKNRIGVEGYFNNADQFYFNVGDASTPDTSICVIHSFNLGLNIHYKFLEKRFIKISVLGGICFNRTNSSIFYKANEASPPTGSGHGYLELDVGGRLADDRVGFAIGIQTKIPIYKNFYAATGAKYNFYPFNTYRPIPEITINSHNLFWDIGIGYTFKTGKKK